MNKLKTFVGAIIAVYLLIVMAPLFLALAVIGAIACLIIFISFYLKDFGRVIKKLIRKLGK